MLRCEHCGALHKITRKGWFLNQCKKCGKWTRFDQVDEPKPRKSPVFRLFCFHCRHRWTSNFKPDSSARCPSCDEGSVWLFDGGCYTRVSEETLMDSFDEDKKQYFGEIYL